MLCYRSKPKKTDDIVCTGGMARKVPSAIFILFLAEVLQIKHFPGHGDTVIDSCVDLPRLEHDMQHLKSFELIPFKQAIEEGADMVVEAHIVFPDITEEKVPVIDLKLKYGLNDQPAEAENLSKIVGIKEHRAVADRAWGRE
jgi:hypothetical protein